MPPIILFLVAYMLLAGTADAQKQAFPIEWEECDKIGHTFNLPAGMINTMPRDQLPWQCTWGFEMGGGGLTPTALVQYLDAALHFSFAIKRFTTIPDAEKELRWLRDELQKETSDSYEQVEFQSGVDWLTLETRTLDPERDLLIRRSGGISDQRIGTCVFEVRGDAGLNDLIEEYHPYDNVTHTYENLHPDFDHGFAKMNAQVDDIVAQGQRILAPLCGGEVATKEPEPEEADMCKNPIAVPSTSVASAMPAQSAGEDAE